MLRRILLVGILGTIFVGTVGAVDHTMGTTAGTVSKKLTRRERRAQARANYQGITSAFAPGKQSFFSRVAKAIGGLFALSLGLLLDYVGLCLAFFGSAMFVAGLQSIMVPIVGTTFILLSYIPLKFSFILLGIVNDPSAGAPVTV